MKFIALFILFSFFASGFALECFVCDSTYEPNCHSMHERNVRTENCDDNRNVGYQRTVCLKTVSFEYGERKTVRSCGRVGPRKDPCYDRRNAVDLSVCELCDDHLCNGSPYLTKSSYMMTLLPIFALLIKYLFETNIQFYSHV